jgi:hypothetical protein
VGSSWIDDTSSPTAVMSTELSRLMIVVICMSFE